MDDFYLRFVDSVIRPVDSHEEQDKSSDVE